MVDHREKKQKQKHTHTLETCPTRCTFAAQEQDWPSQHSHTVLMQNSFSLFKSSLFGDYLTERFMQPIRLGLPIWLPKIEAKRAVWLVVPLGSISTTAMNFKRSNNLKVAPSLRTSPAFPRIISPLVSRSLLFCIPRQFGLEPPSVPTFPI